MSTLIPFVEFTLKHVQQLKLVHKSLEGCKPCSTWIANCLALGLVLVWSLDRSCILKSKSIHVIIEHLLSISYVLIVAYNPYQFVNYNFKFFSSKKNSLYMLMSIWLLSHRSTYVTFKCILKLYGSMVLDVFPICLQNWIEIYIWLKN